MPIIDLQRRLREVGRIRIGEQVPNQSGNGTHPAKLDCFRFTSSDEYAINLVAKTYGGTVQPWAGATVGSQWELYTDSTSLDVIVPPVELAFDQWMEDWAKGFCQHRCDRQDDSITDGPCTCDPDNPTCKPTTRLGVILTAIDGIGRWRLETHGWAAATELSGAIEILKVVQNRGHMVPARLLLEQRQQKKISRETGKPETFKFAVPVLDLQLSVAALTSGGVGNAPRLESGVTPIAPLELESGTIADQMKSVDLPIERPKRANAAEEIRPTGLDPRPAKIANDPDPSPGAPRLTEAQGRMIARLFNKLKITERSDRLDFITVHCGHPFESSKELLKSEASSVITVLKQMAGETDDSKESSKSDAPEYAQFDEAPF